MQHAGSSLSNTLGLVIEMSKEGSVPAEVEPGWMLGCSKGNFCTGPLLGWCRNLPTGGECAAADKSWDPASPS
jgi:hypothetical protein